MARVVRREAVLRRRGGAVHQRRRARARRVLRAPVGEPRRAVSSASSSRTAGGTATRRRARARRSTPRCACSRGCSSTSVPSGPSPAIAAARRRGEEYLLERNLFRRRSTGEVASPAVPDVRVSAALRVRRPSCARLLQGRGCHARRAHGRSGGHRPEAGGRPTADGSSIARTTRRSPFRFRSASR